MKNRFIVCLLCSILLGCANNETKEQDNTSFGLSLNQKIYYQSKDALYTVKNNEQVDLNSKTELSSALVIDKIISRGYGLLGTPYRYGGQSLKTGFDCSGFVGYLLREEAGIKLPRSTREMIKVKANKVARHKLKRGDLLFFATGRGRQVSHIGIYVGDHKFIHSANSRKGVRIDSLTNSYWNRNFLEAKRVIN